MQKFLIHQFHNKPFFSVFLLIQVLLITSCTTAKSNSITGIWENDSKLVQFEGKTFMIVNKKAENTLALRGTFDFSFDYSNVIKMKYLEYMDRNHNWNSTTDTVLENYDDFFVIEIKNDILSMKCLANETLYEYKRTDFPESIKAGIY